MHIPHTWSFSRYDTYALCPYKYKLKFIEIRKEPGSPAMERGNAIHKEAEDYLSAKRPDLPASCGKFSRLMGQLRELNPAVEEKWGFTREWRSTGFFDKKVWLRSILDAGVAYEDGGAEVIDHKTGKRYGSNDEQVELFALTAFQHWPSVRNVTTRLWYLDSGEEVVNEFKREDAPKLRAKWEKRVAPLFEDRQWPARPNEKCRFCHWRASNGGPCRYG